MSSGQKGSEQPEPAVPQVPEPSCCGRRSSSCAWWKAKVVIISYTLKQAMRFRSGGDDAVAARRYSHALTAVARVCGFASPGCVSQPAKRRAMKLGFYPSVVRPASQWLWRSGTVRAFGTRGGHGLAPSHRSQSAATNCILHHSAPPGAPSWPRGARNWRTGAPAGGTAPSQQQQRAGSSSAALPAAAQAAQQRGQSLSGAASPPRPALLDSLDDEQAAAVFSASSAVRCKAGPGSGKTRVIVARVAHLLHSGVAAPNILVITFTNKAAQEVKQRIASLGTAAAGGVTAGTFHGVAATLLRRHAADLGIRGLNANFTILDSDDTASMLKSALLDRAREQLESDMVRCGQHSAQRWAWGGCGLI